MSQKKRLKTDYIDVYHRMQRASKLTKFILTILFILVWTLILTAGTIFARSNGTTGLLSVNFMLISLGALGYHADKYFDKQNKIREQEVKIISDD
jgi:hypothetical protein